MKVLIIYASESKEYVEKLRNKIAEKYGKNSILRMNSRDRENKKRKSIFIHAWHKDACRMMKRADIIVYAVSPKSALNKNVDWEVKKAMNYGKYLVCLSASQDIDIKDKQFLNKRLFIFDRDEKEEKCYADLLENEEKLFSIISDYNNDRYIKLFNESLDLEENKEYLLEQYKIFSDTAEALVTRRQNMNSFYISANTALITVGATVFALCDEKNIISKLLIVLALSIPGIMLNVSWRRTLASYFINNRGKMKILSLLERQLPASLYDAEWKAMKNKYSKEKYVSFTESEKNLPLIFTIFYLAIDIIAVIVLFMLL